MLEDKTDTTPLDAIDSLDPRTLTLDQFQAKAAETALYPDVGACALYPLLGLVNESGEVVEKALQTEDKYSWLAECTLQGAVELGLVCGILKKAYRDHGGVVPEDQVEALYQAAGNAASRMQSVRSLIEHKQALEVRELSRHPHAHSVRAKLLNELSDVTWYLAMLAREWGFSLGQVAVTNLKKLFSRKERGKLQGSGDDR